MKRISGAEKIPAGDTYSLGHRRDPLPIARRYRLLKRFKKPTVMLKRASLPARNHRAAAPSRGDSPQWRFCSVAPPYGGGTASAYTEFLMKSSDTRFLPYLFFILILTSRVLFRQQEYRLYSDDERSNINHDGMIRARRIFLRGD